MSRTMTRFVTCAVLTLAAAVPASLEAARGGGGKTEVLPVTKAAPAVVVIDATGTEADLRRQMRMKNSVTELTGAGPSVQFSQAPTGSFGFIAPQSLGIALVTQSPDLVLERRAPGANAYEIHKLSDGSGLLVGFIGQELVPQVMPAQRPKNVRVALHSGPSDRAPHIAAVPMIKLMVDRMPVRVDSKNPDSPVMLEMDLQSTANRKTPNTP